MRKLQILLADDHDLVREGLKVMIERHPGWKVCGTAATGPEAVAQARKLRPDLVVVDLQLPGCDGLEVTRQVREHLPHCEVLIFTGSGGSDGAIRAAFASGAKSFISKTDAGEYLIDALKSLAEHRPFFTDQASAVVFARFAQAKTPAGRPASGDIERLSADEQNLVRLLSEGHSNGSVAKKRRISVRTVENQRAGIMRKLQLATFPDLVRYAVRNGIIKA